MKKGTLYCVGLGPGDPELMTLKAWHTLQRCSILAIPQDKLGRRTAQTILAQAMENEGSFDWDDKTVVPITFPMTRDKEMLAQAHAKAAEQLAPFLEDGRDVALVTLGCPTVYASCLYVEQLLKKLGYATAIVPGVTSFSAAAARLDQSLCEKDEPLIIIPAGRDDLEELLRVPGNKVLMKVPRDLDALKEKLARQGLLETSSLVERCGLSGERVYPYLADVQETGYFSVIISEKQEEES